VWEEKYIHRKDFDMTVSTAAYLKSHYDAAKAIGAKAISSDFAFEIAGYEQNWLLCKQAPWPELSRRRN